MRNCLMVSFVSIVSVDVIVTNYKYFTSDIIL